MASREQLIFDLLTGKNTLSPSLAQSEKQSKSLSKSIGLGVGGALKGVAVTAAKIAPALLAIGGAFVTGKAVQEAKELENALIGLQSVAGNLGQNVDFITNAAKELSADGLIPLSQTAASLKNLLATGLDGQKAIEVFKALRDSAAFNRQGQLELGEAIVGASEGLKNDLSIKIDNAGITKNLSNITKEYAKEIDKSVVQLTDAERAQAKYVGILKEARVFQGDYNNLLITFSGAQSKASGEFKFLLAEFGQFITQSPVAVTILKGIGDGFKGLKQILIDNRENIQAFVNQGLKAFINLVPPSIEIISLLGSTLGFVGRTALVAGQGWVELLKLVADTKAFEVSAKFIVDTFALISSGLSDLVSLLAGTEFGAKLAEKLGFDPQAIQEKADGIKQSIIDFSDNFTGGEIAEGLDAAGEKLKGAITFTDENIESLQAGFDQAKGLVEDFNKSVANSDSERTRIELANSNKRKGANKSENDEKKKGNKDFYDFTLKAEELNGRQRVQRLSQTLGAISTLQSQKNKELFFIGKAAAIAQATVDGVLAVQKALTAAPPPFNFALAALVGVATAANVASIASAKPPAAQTGGILDPNGSNVSGDFQAFRGNSREAILTQAQQRRFVELAEGAEPQGGAGGGAVIEELRALRDAMVGLLSSQTIEADGREIARVVRDQRLGGFPA